jgi:RNA polymerase sigma-70 factor (ECF subfamily)
MEQTNKHSLFEQWVKDYSDELFSWAFHKTSSREVAEDLVQDTFLSAFKSIENFRGDSKPKTWLFSILNNKIIDYYRKKVHQTDHLETKLNQVAENLFDENDTWKNYKTDFAWQQEEELLDNPEFNRILEECLGNLSEKWRTIITAKFLLEKTAEEICQDLAISMSNYWQISHRAKLILRECIEI